MRKEKDILFKASAEMVETGYSYEEIESYFKDHIPDPKERYFFLVPINELLLEREKRAVEVSNVLSYKILGGLFVLLGFSLFIITYSMTNKAYFIVGIGILVGGILLWNRGRQMQQAMDIPERKLNLRKKRFLHKK